MGAHTAVNAKELCAQDDTLLMLGFRSANARLTSDSASTDCFALVSDCDCFASEALSLAVTLVNCFRAPAFCNHNSPALHCATMMKESINNEGVLCLIARKIEADDRKQRTACRSECACVFCMKAEFQSRSCEE